MGYEKEDAYFKCPCGNGAVHILIETPDFFGGRIHEHIEINCDICKVKWTCENGRILRQVISKENTVPYPSGQSMDRIYERMLAVIILKCGLKTKKLTHEYLLLESAFSHRTSYNQYCAEGYKRVKNDWINNKYYQIFPEGDLSSNLQEEKKKYESGMMSYEKFQKTIKTYHLSGDKLIR